MRCRRFGGLVSALLAIGTFWWGIYTYKETSAAQLKKDEADAKRTADTRRIEATKPFLDKQLTLYTKATALAARIATNVSNPELFQRLKTEFRELYWGEMGLVERADVETAMVKFDLALEAGAPEKELASRALELAQACRNELAASWGTNAWLREVPDDTGQPKF